MNLTIIGATRGIGTELLEQALLSNNFVTVLARNPSAIEKDDNLLRVLRGDIIDADAVDTAIKGQHAVCVTIGQRPTRKPVSLFSDGTKNVIAAMRHHSVKKLVCVTGIGAGSSKGHGGFFYDRIIMPILLQTIYEDKNIQEELVKKSGLEWVIVRPGFLTNGSLTKKYRVLTDIRGVKAGKISRADVAHYILEQLSTMTHVRQAPLLTY
jgi:putative NADH-flavin reductase